MIGFNSLKADPSFLVAKYSMAKHKGRTPNNVDMAMGSRLDIII